MIIGRILSTGIFISYLDKEIEKRILENYVDCILNKSKSSRKILIKIPNSDLEANIDPSSIPNRLMLRDEKCCTQCGISLDCPILVAQHTITIQHFSKDLTRVATIDHILPISKGGANSFLNYQLMCNKCNRSKSNKLPSTIELREQLIRAKNRELRFKQFLEVEKLKWKKDGKDLESMLAQI